MRKVIFTLFVFVFGMIAKAEITTPYPESIEIKQINSAEKERLRLCQGHKKYDKQPTGFYIAAGKKVVVNVEILTPAEQNVMPILTVGTMGFNVGGRNTGMHTTLKAGENIITDDLGGLIWLSFVHSGSADPKGVAKITFKDASEHVRAPRFVYGTTTNMEFKEMLTEYKTPDVLYQSDYVVVAATQEAANTYSKDNNKVAWLNAIHTLLEKEAEISGMDNNDPNPVHHRLKAGEIRFLLVQNTSESPHANSAGYTGYPSASIHRYLTEIGFPGNNTWMLGHELGHQHQQPAYQINMATESTVNIYSYVVERNIQGEGYNRTSAERWRTARNTYLKLPFSKRIYDMDNSALEAITGFNRDELRFMPWEQFFLIYGDQFYKTLHRVVREEKVIGGAADERRSYLIWKASQVTGYDLTEYFNIWGIRVTDSKIKANLRAKMADAKQRSEIFDLASIGRTAEDLVRVTGQDLPEWVPISMRGITSSSSGEAEVLDRSKWTVTTSYEGFPDISVGGDKPENIIDASTTTAFAFVKPGKEYGEISIPADAVPSFTIDMHETKTFNYVAYMHRIGNTSEYIRARQISVYGSNDGMQFTPIKENYVIDHVKNLNEVIVEFPKVSYRYVKVVIEDWNRDSGSTVQVADFNAGTKAATGVLPVPDPIKFRVNVVTDEGIVTSQAGIQMADEDSNYTIEFTTAEGRDISSVTIDGVEVSPKNVDGVYKLTVKITNHLDVNITSKVVAGIETEISENSITIFPNPIKAGQPFYIYLSDKFEESQIEVYNLSGIKLFESKSVDGLVEQVIENQGVYVLKVRKGNDVCNLKVLVK